MRKSVESALFVDSSVKSLYAHAHNAFTSDIAFETGIFEQQTADSTDFLPTQQQKTKGSKGQML